MKNKNVVLEYAMSCREETGSYVPVVDRELCDGNGACVDVCPSGVFDLHAIDLQLQALRLPRRFKAPFEALKQSFASRADRCRECGLCVKHCPAGAIGLVRLGPEWGRPLI